MAQKKRKNEDLKDGKNPKNTSIENNASKKKTKQRVAKTSSKSKKSAESQKDGKKDLHKKTAAKTSPPAKPARRIGRRISRIGNMANVIVSSSEVPEMQTKAPLEESEKQQADGEKTTDLPQEKKPAVKKKTEPERKKEEKPKKSTKKILKIEDLPVVDKKDRPKQVQPSVRPSRLPPPVKKRAKKEEGKKPLQPLPKEEKAAEKIEEKREDERVEKKLPKLAVSTTLTVRELAEKLGVKPVELIKKLMNLGVFATINQRLDKDAAQLVALEYGWDLEIIPIYGEEDIKEDEEEEKPENLKLRPPIITIMGHVDHGKTTLLDALRQSNIVAKEAGQITQHIGAYVVKTPKGEITVLDTPGHEAFTAMRAHGAKVTDIVVLVVSAAGGVQPQTVEAINHARAANVPMIVAINKIDLPNANPRKVMQDLAAYDLVPEEWGGKTVMLEISAKKGINLDKLLDLIILQAELMELKGNPARKGKAIVIEARRDSKKGNLATVINVAGVIKVGDPFIVGAAYGKIRAMITDKGERIQNIGLSRPAEILGITGELPQAGDILRVMESEKEARRIAEKRQLLRKQETFSHQKQVSLLSLKSQIDRNMVKTLNIILKTDVYGSLQALKDSLEKLSIAEVGVNILHAGVGNIAESDLLLAKASNAIIFGFHVDMEPKIAEQSKKEGIEIRLYKVIYDLLEDVKAAMSGMLEPEIVESVTGRAEIKQVFELRTGRVAGSQIREGRITRNQEVKILRSGEVVGTGKVSGLKRFKEDVKQVDKGLECGILIEGYRDFQVGDIIEGIVKEQKIRRLSDV